MDETSSFKVIKLSKFLKDIESAVLSNYDDDDKPGRKKLKKNVNKIFRDYSKKNFKTSLDFMNKFIWDDVLHEESSGVSRTYLLMDNNESIFYAFFTIRLDTLNIDVLDNSIRKNLVLNKKMNAVENIHSIPAHLIEEVAKNMKLDNNPIHMHQIVTYALRAIAESQLLVGGKLAILNSVEDISYLYEAEGFVKFGDIITSSYDMKSRYQPMYLKLD